MNIADRILALVDAREAYENAKSEPARRYQSGRLKAARDRLHAALSAQINESLASFVQGVKDGLDSNSHS